MTIRLLNPTDLVRLSTVIAAASGLRKWDLDLTDTGKPKMEEVQCMRMGDGLYIAANHTEHAAVAHFLAAFGVSNYVTLLDCLRYSHAMLDNTNPARARIMTVQNAAVYSAVERNAITFSAASAVLLPLTPAEVDRAAVLVNMAIDSVPDGERRLAWFLKKFKGGTKKRSPRTAPMPGSAVPGWENFNGARELMLVKSGGKVHA